MRAKEARDLAPDELRQKELELREELFRLRLKRGAGQLADKMRIRVVRRDLARVLTVLGDASSEGKGR